MSSRFIRYVVRVSELQAVVSERFRIRIHPDDAEAVRAEALLPDGAQLVEDDSVTRGDFRIEPVGTTHA